METIFQSHEAPLAGKWTCAQISSKAEIYSGRFKRIPIGAIRLVQKVRGDSRQFAVRFFESATTKPSEFCYERNLDPEVGRWTITRSPILPGFEYKLAYSFIDETSEKPIEVFVRPGCRRIDKLVTMLKSLSEDPNSDVRPSKRRADPMEETLKRNDIEKTFKRRPFGVGLTDSFTHNRQPDKSTPSSAPAKTASRNATPKTPTRKSHKDYLSMTISGRLSSDPAFCRNLSQTLNFEEQNGDKIEGILSPSKSQHASPRAEFSPTKMPPKGGLRNIGNSCYMNACISALAKTTCWVDMLLAIPVGSTVNDSSNPISLSEDDREENPSVLSAVVEVIRNLQNGGSEDGAASEMAHLRQSLGHYHIQFANRKQQDAHEFLSGLIDKIEQEANCMKLGKKIMYCISSTTSNQICCTSCKYSRSKSEQCWNFSLNLPELSIEPDCEPRCCPEHGLQLQLVAKTMENRGRQFWACRSPTKCTALPFKWVPESHSAFSSVSALFSKYFDQHPLEYRCERCPSNHAVLQPAIAQIPKVLILHLKRFHSNLKTNQCTKRNDPVMVELSLDISRSCSDERIRETGANYRLRSVISHIGLEAGTGHYVHDYRDHQKNIWTRYDDSSVKSVAEITVLETAKTQAYILFYDLDE